MQHDVTRVDPTTIDLDIESDQYHCRMQLLYCSLLHDTSLASMLATMTDLHINVDVWKMLSKFPS